MRVVGTAGHVDHGKSTLVRCLTGIDPDRLAEEKAREMTIDLGFAWLALPDGQTVGLVDVPGHRDFIENMLAGVGGIDAVLLVIAADEGVMPQTREHLAILDLLGIHHGLIVLTKIDMVDDPDWLDLVERDIQETVAGTGLAGAEVLRVSGRTGEGLPRLVERLTALLADMPPRTDYHAPRLPIDRVFTISGFGTVVTGTLLGGSLRVGEDVEIQPGGVRGRIRGLQSYKMTVTVAEPGSRVAVNLSGVDKRLITRGDVLTLPGHLQSTVLADLRFRHLPDTGRPLKHQAEVKIFVGAAEAVGRVRLLGDEVLPPGAEGWLQIQLATPLALAQGDRFILRYPSPSQTIGGGLVVNPNPGRRWRRFQPQTIEQLRTRLQGSPAERVAQAAVQPMKRANLQQVTSLPDLELDTAISDGLQQGLLVELASGDYLSRVVWAQLARRIEDEVRAFHAAEPLRVGMPREQLRSKLGLKVPVLNALLEGLGQVVTENDLLRFADHRIQFNPTQLEAIDRLNQVMAANPYTPPSFTEAAQIVGEEVLRALIDLGEIVQVQPDVILTQRVYDEMLNAVFQMIDEQGQVTAANLRDRFGTTRKYAIGLLEYLDSAGITRRVGDGRVRGHRGR